MGYVMTCCAVSLTDLEDAVGSGNESLLANVKKKFSREIKEDRDELLGADVPALDDILTEIIRFGITPNLHYGQTGYAVELIAKSLSKRYFANNAVPNRAWINGMFRIGLPFALPTSTGFPAFWHIDAQEFTEFSEQIAQGLRQAFGASSSSGASIELVVDSARNNSLSMVLVYG